MNRPATETAGSSSRKHAHSILDAPVSTVHRIADDTGSVEERGARLARTVPTRLWAAHNPFPTQGKEQGQHPDEADHREPSPARIEVAGDEVDLDSLPFTIKAEINAGFVDFRVRGRNSPVTFCELVAACAQQLPGVVLERRTKWLQRTFDLWSHAGQCLYAIPIANQPDAVHPRA